MIKKQLKDKSETSSLSLSNLSLVSFSTRAASSCPTCVSRLSFSTVSRTPTFSASFNCFLKLDST